MNILIQLIQSWAMSLGALLPNEAAANAATAARTALAASKVRLFQGPGQISYATPLATLVAGEANYEGYTAGGNTIATWGLPLSVSPTGWAINAETTFAYVDASPHTANTITGGWVENADGDFMFAFNLPSPVTLSANGEGFVLQLQNIYGRGS